eukprot:Hpha_TRINITY_DN7068_c0_g1::TRINITY_DN7068_c0_g1_i1::g.22843::m.22843
MSSQTAESQFDDFNAAIAQRLVVQQQPSFKKDFGFTILQLSRESDASKRTLRQLEVIACLQGAQDALREAESQPRPAVHHPFTAPAETEQPPAAAAVQEQGRDSSEPAYDAPDPGADTANPTP